jgi:hypothetical protein
MLCVSGERGLRFISLNFFQFFLSQNVVLFLFLSKTSNPYLLSKVECLILYSLFLYPLSAVRVYITTIYTWSCGVEAGGRNRASQLVSQPLPASQSHDGSSSSHQPTFPTEFTSLQVDDFRPDFRRNHRFPINQHFPQNSHPSIKLMTCDQTFPQIHCIWFFFISHNFSAQ